MDNKHMFLNVACEQGLKGVPDKTVNFICSDPPYNIAHKRKLSRKDAKDISFDFGEWDYFDSIEDYKKWGEEWIKECHRVLDDNGHLFLWQDKLLPLSEVLEDNGFEIRNVFVWIKSNPVPQFMKVNFLSALEFGVWATKKGSKRKDQTYNFTTQNDMHNVMRETNQELAEFFAKEMKFDLFIDEEGFKAMKTPIVMGKERIGHPTQKPLSVTNKLIQLYSNPGDVVMDLFTGSGTTYHSCVLTDRTFWGFEIAKEYFDMTNDRINKVLEEIQIKERDELNNR